MGRQLFEKEGLYLHKRPWKGKKTYRKKDRARKQEREKEREKRRRKRKRGVGEWTALAKLLRDKSCG